MTKKLIVLLLSVAIILSMVACGSNSGSSVSSGSSGSSGSSTGTGSSFRNKYGTPTTYCAHSGCTKYIASSGDTNCCTTHSNRCLECRCYIDEDAMYCMDCLTGSLGDSHSKSNSESKSSHDCYICGKSAYSKYGSYYYCSSCLALVKAFS